MDNIKQWLAERKTIYFIFALLYDGNIDKALEIIRENELLEHFERYSENEFLSTGSSKMIKEIDENSDNSNYKDLILDDHQRLFVGPDEILAPLWESAYKAKDKLLFGEVELEVREFYNSYGLDIKANEPADHLPLELSFMSHLCNIDGEDNLENIIKCLEKQLNFLKEHLLSWIPLLVENVSENSETKFWTGLVQLTRGWLENDLDEIEKVIKF